MSPRYITLAEEAVIDAARDWRRNLIPNTGTSGWTPAYALQRAVDMLDCDHPRAHLVSHDDGRRSCGRCGSQLPADELTHDPG